MILTAITHFGSNLVAAGIRRFRHEDMKMAPPNSLVGETYEAKKPPGIWVTM
jgi:hypothetical protein